MIMLVTRGRSLLATLALLVLAGTVAAEEHATAKVRIIFDSDMCGNHDDMGAIAVLHSLAMSGEAEILATMTSVDGECWDCSIRCMMAINHYYGRSDIPVGRVKFGNRHNRTSRYAGAVAKAFPYDSTKKVWDAVTLYRKVLSEQPDNSVVICTVGFLTNINHLLASGPDQYSDLNGVELARKKCLRWVAMGGTFPKGSYDTNFATDGLSKGAIDNWPKLLVIVPMRLAPVYTGKRLVNLPPHHPIRFAYRVASGKEPSDHQSPDAVAVLAAVRNPSLYFDEEKRGSLHFTNGSMYTWEYSLQNDRHIFLKPRVNLKQVAEIIDKIMADPRTAQHQSR